MVTRLETNGLCPKPIFACAKSRRTMSFRMSALLVMSSLLSVSVVHAADGTCENVRAEYEALWELLEDRGTDLNQLNRLISAGESNLRDQRHRINNQCIAGLSGLLPTREARADCETAREYFEAMRDQILQDHAAYNLRHAAFMADLVRWERLSEQLDSACSAVAADPQVDAETCGRTKRGYRWIDAIMYDGRPEGEPVACNAGAVKCWKCEPGYSWGVSVSSPEVGSPAEQIAKGEPVQCGRETDVPDCD